MTTKAITKKLASVAAAASVLAGGAVALGVTSTGAAHAATTLSVQANTSNPDANVSIWRYNFSTGSWQTVTTMKTDAKGRFYSQQPAGYWYHYMTSKVSMKYTGVGAFGMSPCTIYTWGGQVYADP